MKPLYISLKPFLNHAMLARPTDWPLAFGNANTLEVEIGFGNGEYLARLSKAHPEINFIGFEQYCERIARTLRKLSRTGLNNVRVLRLDARAGFERYVKPKSVAVVHCLYPPPWPKKSAAKHRLFTTAFLKTVNSRLIDGGILKIVTDHRPYIAWVEDNVPLSGFKMAFKTIAAGYNTKFENKWVEQGQKEFYELILTKEHHQDVPLKEDVPVQTYIIDHFDPDTFVMPPYSKGGIAVAFKDLLYDAKRKTALIYVIVSDEGIMQNIRIVIAHTNKGWRIHLAEGTLLMPTQGVAQALACVQEAALASCAK